MPEQGAGPGDPRRAARGCGRSARRCRARFHASQVGTIRPGLTLEDGTLVVTDNYLKVRIPAGLPRNERVRVRVTDTAVGL